VLWVNSTYGLLFANYQFSHRIERDLIKNSLLYTNGIFFAKNLYVVS